MTTDAVRDAEITRNSFWKTKDGRQLRIVDMTDSHLLNTIRVLREMSPINTICHFPTLALRRSWLNVMANEAYSRGLSLDDLSDDEPIHE